MDQSDSGSVEGRADVYFDSERAMLALCGASTSQQGQSVSELLQRLRCQLRSREIDPARRAQYMEIDGPPEAFSLLLADLMNAQVCPPLSYTSRAAPSASACDTAATAAPDPSADSITQAQRQRAALLAKMNAYAGSNSVHCTDVQRFVCSVYNRAVCLECTGGVAGGTRVFCNPVNHKYYSFPPHTGTAMATSSCPHMHAKGPRGAISCAFAAAVQLQLNLMLSRYISAYSRHDIHFCQRSSTVAVASAFVSALERPLASDVDAAPVSLEVAIIIVWEDVADGASTRRLRQQVLTTGHVFEARLEVTEAETVTQDDMTLTLRHEVGVVSSTASTLPSMTERDATGESLCLQHKHCVPSQLVSLSPLVRVGTHNSDDATNAVFGEWGWGWLDPERLAREFLQRVEWEENTLADRVLVPRVRSSHGTVVSARGV